MPTLRRLIAITLATALLAACNEDPKQSELTLSVTDAPIDGATAVVVSFTGVELQPRGGERVIVSYDPPRTIDLLALQGGLSSRLLDDFMVPVGEYSWIRLMVGSSQGTTESYITLDDGSVHPLYIPSGGETGLKLHGGLTVAAGGESDFTVDFDLRKSVHAPASGNSYMLRPTLRLVDNLLVGAIAGSVDAALIPTGCTPAVYAYTGTVTPDDVGGSGPQPMSTTTVVTDSNGSTYMLAFLEAGTYTVAFTCQAAIDMPLVDEVIGFAPVVQATVTADAITTVNLVP